MKFHQTALGLAVALLLSVSVSPAHAGGSLPFAEDVLYSLEQSPLAQSLLHLEFYPTATAETIGKQYPDLSGTRIGPYECLARVPNAENKPGVYQYRVIISTAVTYADKDGKETTLDKGAVSKTERATEVTIKPLTDAEKDTKDKESEPVLLSEVLAGNENSILDQECFFLNNKPLRVGMTAKQVEALLKPAAIVKGKAEMVEATGDIEETWEVAELDLDITFDVSPEDKSKTVSHLSAGPKSKVETARGIKAGHPESRAKDAYQEVINKRDSTEGEVLIIGNMYLGLFIGITDGKVGSLYLGPGAE